MKNDKNEQTNNPSVYSAKEHTFLKHADDCYCALCQTEAKVCEVCHGVQSATQSTLTKKCLGHQIPWDKRQKIADGELDFDGQFWFNPQEGANVLDEFDINIGSLLKREDGKVFVCYSIYTNRRHQKGVRLIECSDKFQQSPEMLSTALAYRLAGFEIAN